MKNPKVIQEYYRLRQTDTTDMDLHLDGFHACLRKKPFDPSMPYVWREGYARAKAGHSLTQRELNYLMR